MRKILALFTLLFVAFSAIAQQDGRLIEPGHELIYKYRGNQRPYDIQAPADSSYLLISYGGYTPDGTWAPAEVGRPVWIHRDSLISKGWFDGIINKTSRRSIIDSLPIASIFIDGDGNVLSMTDVNTFRVQEQNGLGVDYAFVLPTAESLPLAISRTDSVGTSFINFQNGRIQLKDSTNVYNLENLQVQVKTLARLQRDTFTLGTRVKVEETGAEYLIQSDSVAGYEVDEVAVVTNGSNYAVLQPINGAFNVKHFGAIGDNSNNDTEPIQKGLNYSYLNSSVLFFPAGNYVIQEQLNMPGGEIKGVNYEIIDPINPEYQSLLRWKSETPDTILNLPYVGTNGYSDGQTIRNIGIIADSSAMMGIYVDRPTGRSATIENVNIRATANTTPKTLDIGIKVSGSISYILNKLFVQRAGTGVVFDRSNPFISTTTTLENSYISLCDTAIIFEKDAGINFYISNSITESSTVGIKSNGDNEIFINQLYTENIGDANNSALQFGKSGVDKVYISSSSIIGGNSDLAKNIFEIDSINIFSVTQTDISRGDTLITLTENSRNISFDNVVLTTVTVNPLNNKIDYDYRINLKNVTRNELITKSLNEFNESISIKGGFLEESYPTWRINNTYTFQKGELEFRSSALNSPSLTIRPNNDIHLFHYGTGTPTTSGALYLYKSPSNTVSPSNDRVGLAVTDDGTGGTRLLGFGSEFNFVGRLRINEDVRFSEYGAGNKSATDLSKTASGLIAAYATDGTLIEQTFDPNTANSSYQFTPFPYNAIDTIPVDTLLTERFAVPLALNGKSIRSVEYTTDSDVTTRSTIARLVKFTPPATYTTFATGTITAGNNFVVFNIEGGQTINQGDLIYCETTQTGDNISGLTVTLKIE